MLSLTLVFPELENIRLNLTLFFPGLKIHHVKFNLMFSKTEQIDLFIHVGVSLTCANFGRLLESCRPNSLSKSKILLLTGHRGLVGTNYFTFVISDVSRQYSIACARSLHCIARPSHSAP